jgi:murein DD-endopeptidase MepM/ murein hydrolase activator NlpD
MRRLLTPIRVGPAILAVPSAASADAGGATAPRAGASSGGALAGRPLAAAAFAAAPARVIAGRALGFRLRLSGARPRARVLVELSGRRASVRIPFGRRPTARLLRLRWAPARGQLPAGIYRARVVLPGAAARFVRSSAVTVVVRAPARPVTRAPVRATPTPAPTATPIPVPARSAVFPVQGPYTFGGEGARFGAGRAGHLHQGQDVVAAEGTPLVAPVAGTVYWTAYQAKAAGYYVVIRAADGTDYVFMHLQAGSTAVAKGQAVAMGQRIGLIGATGDASGPHLHFEVWPGGWWSSAASQPIDPLPILEAWAAG